MQTLVTFDLFSALIDSRAGGSAAFAAFGADRRWARSGGEVYDTWDALNKAAQRDCRSWVSYAVLAERALTACYERLGLVGNPARDTASVIETMSEWPLWPDVSEGLPRLAMHYRIGLLSNVDNDIFSRTRAAPFLVADNVFTSERLGVYKPHPHIYERARERAGSLVHVATSARDVRGAAESGIEVIRLRRPGHGLDANGPVPRRQVESLTELERMLGEDS